LNVLQINTVCGTGSTGRIATDIEAILKEQGHESYIAYGRGDPRNSDSPIRIGNKLDNYTHVAKTRLLDMHGFGSKKATKNFIKKVREIDPDVIHLHNIHGYYINVEILFDYLKEANKPVVWTLHDCWPFTGHCAYFDFARCDCWRVDGTHKCIQKRSYPASLLINNSKMNYERKRKAFTGIKNLTIVTPSQWLADLVKKSFLKEYTIEIVNNGIDLEVFKPTESDFRRRYNLQDKHIILGVANMWEQRKGINDFIQLSKQLDSSYKIVLVGVSKKQIKKLPKNILCIPRTNNIKELAEIYTAADIYVNPSVEETMGLTTVEAFACGTPAIVYNTTAVPESIDASCGIVIDKGNFNNLYMEIKGDRIKQIEKQNCIKRANFFEKRIKFEKYIQMYIRANFTNGG
jgi:putative colanic acid biosynthesis glycosyltransferase